jgi:hypothetical protein
MKKSMIKKLVVLLVVMVVAGGFVFGEDFSDQAPTLDLNGTVAGVFSVAFQAGSTGTFGDSAVAFDIENSAATNLSDLFKVKAMSNANNGFTVTLAYDGVLNADEEGVANDATIDYDLEVGGTLVAKDSSGTAVIMDNNGVTNEEIKSIDLVIDAPTTDYYAAGDYSDTITVTLAAK